jgi:hypothetical protein
VEVKQKYIKATQNKREYIYYHCTKSKGCSQTISIRQDILEVQITDQLKKYKILPQFKNWAINSLKASSEREAKDRKT